MKDSLQPGITYELRYRVGEEKTVPHLYPEAPEFRVMPKVLASGFAIGLVEWACIQAVNAHLDWPSEQTVGVGFYLRHLAPTPPGLVVTVSVKLESVEGRRLTFSVTADDGIDRILEGTHERFVIDAGKFGSRVAAKAASAAQ
ncbi:MAG: thioesterase family protein [Firmicutes bacterium]|nr:thioesterase family protein [Bacillota bacterium]